MPILNFQSRFVPFIRNKKKYQTIRKNRKRPFRVGDKLYLYTGLRTKYCQKIDEVICLHVFKITIKKTGEVYVADKRLDEWEKDILAFCDGFRSDLEGYEECFEVMFRWFEKMHTLPFEGQIIIWE